MHDSKYVGNRTSAAGHGAVRHASDEPRARGRRGRTEIVLIGPACAGKSTVGDLLGEALSTAHVDADHVAERYYLEAGWSAERFRSVEGAPKHRPKRALRLPARDRDTPAIEETTDGSPTTATESSRRWSCTRRDETPWAPGTRSFAVSRSRVADPRRSVTQAVRRSDPL